jgi:hypothetical protein
MQIGPLPKWQTQQQQRSLPATIGPLFFISLKQYLNIQFYLLTKSFAQKCKAKVNKTDFTTIRVAIKRDYDEEEKTESNKKVTSPLQFIFSYFSSFVN